MPIYQTGGYQVNPSAVNKVKEAIRGFVAYVQANETGAQMYLAWQEKIIQRDSCIYSSLRMKPHKPGMVSQRQ
jgi:hypothetical protein